MKVKRLQLKDAKTPKLFGSQNLDIFRAVLTANRQPRVGIGRFVMFPYSTDAAKRPQHTGSRPK